jgi:hypothetical protein
MHLHAGGKSCDWYEVVFVSTCLQVVKLESSPAGLPNGGAAAAAATPSPAAAPGSSGAAPVQAAAAAPYMYSTKVPPNVLIAKHANALCVAVMSDSRCSKTLDVGV